MAATSKLPKNQECRYVTIEKIKNGFMLAVPVNMGVSSEKFFRGTMNGVVHFLEDLWEVKVVDTETESEIAEVENEEKPDKVSENESKS